MDVRCPMCGEPIELEELSALRPDLSLSDRLHLFLERGCGAFLAREPCNRRTGAAKSRSDLWDALGNDPDGLLAAWEDQP